MQQLLVRAFGRKRMKQMYYNITCFLNPGYRRALNRVKKQFILLTAEQQEELHQLVCSRYQSEPETPEDDTIRRQDIEDHSMGRLSGFRHRTVPWLNSIKPLNQCNVLEIGCGTGCTTVALAEQGCNLTSIDVSRESVELARKRSGLYGLAVDIRVLNAAQISEHGGKYDLIIFPDSLEHMTYAERIASIRAAWSLLENDGLLAVVGTPNRLYFFDRHSSLLPFYHWLPDELAMQYARYSPRQACIDSPRDITTFLRFGRGASYHEFELALEIKGADLEMYDMQSFMKTLLLTKLAHRTEYRYMKMLKALGPAGLPRGFYWEQLHIAIRKPSQPERESENA